MHLDEQLDINEPQMDEFVSQPKESEMPENSMDEEDEKSQHYLHIRYLKDLNQTVNQLEEQSVAFGLVEIEPEEALPLDKPVPPKKEKKPRPKNIRVKGCCEDIKITIMLPEDADVTDLLQYCPLCQQRLDGDLEEHKGKWRWTH